MVQRPDKLEINWNDAVTAYVQSADLRQTDELKYMLRLLSEIASNQKEQDTGWWVTATENEDGSFHIQKSLSSGGLAWVNYDSAFELLEDKIVIDYESKSTKARVVADNKEALIGFSAADLSPLAAKIKEHADEVNFKRNRYHLVAKYASGQLESVDYLSEFMPEMLALNGSVGLSVIRDRLSPDFTGQATVLFNYRNGVAQKKIGLSAHVHYFYERNEDKSFSTFSNTFFDLKFGWRPNITKEQWVVLGAGLLTFRNGDIFEGGTGKITLEFLTIRKFIDLNPELILTNDFKTPIPMMRFGITF